MNPSSFTGGISVKVYEIHQEMRGKYHRHRLFGKERHSRIRSPVNSPRHFEDNIPGLLGILQMQWQRQAKTLMPVLSDGTDCVKYYHTEVEYGVKKRKHCTEAEHGRDTCGRHRVRFGQF